MIYIGLFLSFFQIGFFSFGGGLATIPFLEHLAFSTGWFSNIEIMNMIAISEATPGPLGINMATYVGFLSAGILGSIFALFGLVLPSLIVILGICKVYEKIRNNQYARKMFYGLHAASMGLIFLAFFSTFKVTCLQSNVDGDFFEMFCGIKVVPVIVISFIFTLIKMFKLHPFFYITLAAIVGVIFQL